MYAKNISIALVVCVWGTALEQQAYGGNWIDLQNPGPGYNYTDIFFVDPGHGCLVVNDQASSRQAAPTLAVDAAGVIYMAWEDERNANKDIYFSKSVDGGASWSQHTRVNSAGPGLAYNQNKPSLVVDASGSFLAVAWHDSRSGNIDIYFAQSTDGGLSWQPEAKINTDNSQDQTDVDLALDIAGNLYAVWSDGRDAATRYIYFRKRNFGTSVWEPEKRIDADLSGDSQQFPALAVDGAGSVYAVWQGTPKTSDTSIYFARSLDGGVNWSAEIKVDAAPAATFQTYPSILLGQDTIHVAWQDNRHGADEAAYTSKSNTTVISFGNEVRIDDGTNPVLEPVLAGDSTDLYAIWTEGTLNDYNVHASHSDDAGLSWSNPELRVNDDSTGHNRAEPGLVVDSGGRVIAVWRDERNPNNDDIYLSVSNDQGGSWSTNRRLYDPDFKIGVIYYTWNGATTPWQRAVTNMARVPALQKIVFSNDTTGWAVGDEGTLLKSIDGGENWEQQFWTGRIGDEQLLSVFFFDDVTGYVIGPSVLLRTADGSSWTSLPATLLDGRDVVFVDEQRGWAVSASPQSGRTVFETQGASIDWSPVSQTDRSLFGVAALSSDHVWVAGDAATLMQYRGGDPLLDWHQAVLPGSSATADFRDVAVSAATNLVIWSVGLAGVIVHTPDRGSSWIEDQVTNPDNLDLVGLSVVDWNNAWAVGNHPDNGGRILTYGCQVHADCDDKLICNGQESCLPPCTVGPQASDNTACEQACAWCQSGVCSWVDASVNQDPFDDCPTCRVCDGSGSCRNATDGTDPKGECDVGSCDDCYTGACGPAPNTCLILGKCYGSGDFESATPCLKCDPTKDQKGWTPDPDDTVCGVCAWCQAGVCQAVPKEQDPFGDCSVCQICDGELGCTNALDGSDPKSECLAGTCDECYAGACAAGDGTCLILGNCFDQGTAQAGNDCMFCDPEQNQTDWTSRANGESCGLCAWCQTGLCTPIPDNTDPHIQCGVCEVCDGSNNCRQTFSGQDPKDECIADACQLGFCDGFGSCQMQTSGFPCGNQEDLDCDLPDTCDGAGACLTNFVEAGRPCGQAVVSECDLADTCDGMGKCADNHVPSGQGACLGGCHPCNGAGGCDALTNLIDDTACLGLFSCNGVCRTGFCMVEGFCERQIENCEITLSYGIGDGETLNCRLPQEKVSLRLYVDTTMLELCDLAPVRIELTNHDLHGWSKPVYGLEILIEFESEETKLPIAANLAFVLGTARLNGSNHWLNETIIEDGKILLHPEDPWLELPLTTNGEPGWIVEFVLALGAKIDVGDDMKLSAWTQCATDTLDKIGCHDEWEDEVTRRPDRQRVSNFVRLSDAQSALIEQRYDGYLGCGCVTKESSVPMSLGYFWLLLGLLTRRYVLRKM